MQPPKEWIKECITMLKKQAGFAFNHDLFISMLLCLIGEQDNHLILTAPPERLEEVALMAAQIARGIFGFTTARFTCQENQTTTHLFRALLASEPDLLPLRDSHRTSERTAHRQSRSAQGGFLLQSSNRSRTPGSIQEDDQSDQHSLSYLHQPSPISPIDFTLRRKRDHRLSAHLSPDSSSGQSQWMNQDENMRLYPTSNRLAQTLVIQDLDKASDLVQAALLELVITKELRISNVRYNVPRSHFMVIVVLPHEHDRLCISSQLLDRFSISYTFSDLSVDTMPPNTLASSSTRRIALIKSEGRGGLRELEDMASKVYIDVDVTRYIRDIVVGIRTHPRVQGGVTARSSQDLVRVSKCLAAVLGYDYLTPDTVNIAVENVLRHRVRILPLNESGAETGDLKDFSTILEEVLKVVAVPE